MQEKTLNRNRRVLQESHKESEHQSYVLSISKEKSSEVESLEILSPEVGMKKMAGRFCESLGPSAPRNLSSFCQSSFKPKRSNSSKSLWSLVEFDSASTWALSDYDEGCETSIRKKNVRKEGLTAYALYTAERIAFKSGTILP
jgi:hypothetical protein